MKSDLLSSFHIRHTLLLMCIQAFDKNRDGYIDVHELQLTMHELGMKLSSEDIGAMMLQAECRITGRVYYEG